MELKKRLPQLLRTVLPRLRLEELQFMATFLGSRSAKELLCSTELSQMRAILFQQKFSLARQSKQPKLLVQALNAFLMATNAIKMKLSHDGGSSPVDLNYVQSIEEHPLLFYVGEFLLEYCYDVGETPSMAESKEMQAVMKKLLCNFFKLLLVSWQIPAPETAVAAIESAPVSPLRGIAPSLLPVHHTYFEFLMALLGKISKLPFVITKPGLLFTLMEMMMPLAFRQEDAKREPYCNFLINLHPTYTASKKNYDHYIALCQQWHDR